MVEGLQQYVVCMFILLFSIMCVVCPFLRSAISEDIDKIRLVRELKEKSSSVVSLQTQVKALERQLSTVQQQNVHLLEEMERVNVEVKEVNNLECVNYMH